MIIKNPAKLGYFFIDNQSLLCHNLSTMETIKSPNPLNREISAGVIVFRRTEEGPKFLILYHGHNYWNFPKGKIESEEKSWDAAVRELREETGLELKDLKFKRSFKAYEKFNFYREGRRIFKIVIFYLAETTNRDIKISEEHHGYGWFLHSEAKKILGKYKDSQRILELAKNFCDGVKKPVDLPVVTTTRRTFNRRPDNRGYQAKRSPQRPTTQQPNRLMAQRKRKFGADNRF